MIMATKTAGEKDAKTQVCAFFNATTHQTLPPQRKERMKREYRNAGNIWCRHLKTKQTRIYHIFVYSICVQISSRTAPKKQLTQNGPSLRTQDHRVTNHCTIACEMCPSPSQTNWTSVILLKKHDKTMRTKTPTFPDATFLYLFLCARWAKSTKRKVTEQVPDPRFCTFCVEYAI